MALYPRVPTGNNKTYTLDSQIAAGATTVTLNESVTGVVRAPGYFVVERINTSGSLTPNDREYKYFTGVSGTQLTGVSSVDGTDQIHPVGSIVEFVPTVNHENDKYSVFTTEHTDIGTHASLPSISFARIGNLQGMSQASLNLINARSIALTSMASIPVVTVNTHFNVSTASLSGLPVYPTWVIAGTVSGATTSIGKPLSMPKSGTVQWVSVTLNSPISGASLLIDINKNATTLFTDQNTRLTILGGGTFASTASVSVKAFNSGDKISVDVDAGGWFTDATVQMEGR